MTRHIVVATDFSPASTVGLEWGALVAAAHGATLHLVHGVPPLQPAGDHIAMPADLGARLVAATHDRLEDLAAPQRAAGLTVECLGAMGRPAQIVLDEARRLDAALVVLGTRSHAGVARFPLGSTAARVIQKAECPVLAVHPEDRRPTQLPRHVLVPTDLSDDARITAERVTDLFRLTEREGSLLLFHAWALAADYTLYERASTPFFAAYREEAIAASRRLLAEQAAALRRPGLEVEPLLREGRPADLIVDLAAERGVGLTAMSTHGLSGIERLVLGSIAQQVVQHAPSPVLTVRPA